MWSLPTCFRLWQKSSQLQDQWARLYSQDANEQPSPVYESASTTNVSLRIKGLWTFGEILGQSADIVAELFRIFIGLEGSELICGLRLEKTFQLITRLIDAINIGPNLCQWI